MRKRNEAVYHSNLKKPVGNSTDFNLQKRANLLSLESDMNDELKLDKNHWTMKTTNGLKRWFSDFFPK